MAVKTTEEQLEEIQTAITAIIGGAQSYTMAGTTFTRATLDTLYKREDLLQRRYRQEQGSKPRVSQARFDNSGGY